MNCIYESLNTEQDLRSNSHQPASYDSSSSNLTSNSNLSYAPMTSPSASSLMMLDINVQSTDSSIKQTSAPTNVMLMVSISLSVHIRCPKRGPFYLESIIMVFDHHQFDTQTLKCESTQQH